MQRGGRGGGMDVHDRRAELSSIFLFQLLEKDLHFLAICCALSDEMKALYRSKVSILSLNLIQFPKRKKSMARDVEAFVTFAFLTLSGVSSIYREFDISAIISSLNLVSCNFALCIDPKLVVE
jgi:hypothetical protein